MTYEEALAEARTKSVSHASDPALMAAFCDANIQTLIGAVSPKLVWDGAQKKGLATRDLVDMCGKDPMAVADLMWVD